jgi:hypothetical protein
MSQIDFLGFAAVDSGDSAPCGPALKLRVGRLFLAGRRPRERKDLQVRQCVLKTSQTWTYELG